MRVDASFQPTWFRPLSLAHGTVISGFTDGSFIFAGSGQPGADFGAGAVSGAPSAHYSCVVRYDGTGAVSFVCSTLPSRAALSLTPSARFGEVAGCACRRRTRSPSGKARAWL